MDGNSSKPGETGNPQVFALRVVLRWFEQEAGRNRAAALLRRLLETTIVALERGDPPPKKDAPSLLELALREGELTTSRPVKGSELRTWWEYREAAVRAKCLAEGCQWEPRLVVDTGGGRGLSNLYGFELDPIQEETIPVAEFGAASGRIRYSMDPVRPTLWYRWFLGDEPFLVNSWRGYVLLGAVLIDFAFIALIWVAIYLSWTLDPRPVTTADIVSVAMAVLITLGLWHFTKPIRQLPTRRVTLAGPALPAMNELYAQLRAMPDQPRLGRQRMVSLVRHWGTCPMCAAEVDLDEGGVAFPGRLVGRCHDAPEEHVFSFDPVSLEGSPMRNFAPER